MKTMIVGFISLVASHFCFAQAFQLPKPDSIQYAVHAENKGRVVFMDHIIPIEQLTRDSFLSEVTLHPEGSLYIRVFMDNSLTHYLHTLAPALSADQLVSNGNFKFTFFIDGVEIYSENLHPGAFGAANKNTRKVFRIPLYSVQKEDSWGRFLWQRFWMSGGEDELSEEGNHELTIQIRPYLQTDTLWVGDPIAEGSIRVVSKESAGDSDVWRLQKPSSAHEWSLSSSGMDTTVIEQMNKKIMTGVFKDITSIVVIREGQLWLEEYFNGADKATLHDTRSVGKSCASAILGLAIADGYIKSEEESLHRFYNLKQFKNYTPDKNNITLKSLLTMTSPFEGSDRDEGSPGHENKMYDSKDWVQFVLDLPLNKQKLENNQWDYFTGGVVVLGDILHRSLPMGLEAYSKKRLFEPLGIDEFQWEFTPQQVANTAGGLRLRAIDLAKFGQLYQNKGSWHGSQILASEWCKKSLDQQVEISKEEGYGYLFWTQVLTTNNRQYNVSYASGNGGNKVYVFNDASVIVVITSKAYDQAFGQVQSERLLKSYLLKAML